MVDPGTGVDGQKAFVYDGVRRETPRVVILEQRTQGLTASVQLLMEQN